MPRLKTKEARRLPQDFEDLVRLYPPRAIHDDIDYDNTQEMIDALTSIANLTDGQGRYLDTLTVLLGAYEDEHYQIDASSISPRDVLRALMEEHEMNASALGALLGDRALGSRVLSGERELSKSHIRKLSRHFNVNPGVFF